MNYKAFLKTVFLMSLAIVLLFVLPSLSSQIKNNEVDTNQSSQTANDKQSGNITITIEGVLPSQSVTLSAGQTVLQLLQELDNTNPDINLVTKEYKGLGVLVEGIGEITNGTEGKYWQYKVNGVMPQIGADQYNLKDGDTVEWYFAQSNL